MRRSQPLVSVVMAFLNAERFIQESIESVLAQTYDSWELLLVDDGSTDASAAIARRYCESHGDRIRYLEHPGHANRGASASRNLGIRESSGGYLAFLDSDDTWFAHKLERQVAILEEHPTAELVYGRSEYWHGWTGEPADIARDHIPELGVTVDTLYPPGSLTLRLYPLAAGTAPCPSDLLMRRRSAVAIGGFEEQFVGDYQLYEDQAFLAKVYLQCNVYVSGACWDRYRIHPASCSSRVTRSGTYRRVRQSFLDWFTEYLHDQRVNDIAILRAIESASRILQQPDTASWRKWSLRVAGDSMAHLVPVANDSDAVRVVIDKVGGSDAFDIQLNVANLKLRAGQNYQLTFRARADAPRSIAVGVAEAHAPWAGLGWYQRINLSSEWQDFSREFAALRSDESARIHFDLGDSSTPTELAALNLHHLGEGDAQQPDQSGALSAVDFGDLRRTTPIGSVWGFDRGLPIDRYYIEAFLAREAEYIRGHVLEFGDDSYTRQFGGTRVGRSDVLHIAPGNPRATIVGDLTTELNVASNTFDCIILTQVLHFIYDLDAAVRTLARILKPGGVVLATVPGISPVRREDWGGSWQWAFRSASARRLFDEHFSPSLARVDTFGNVLAATAFLHGLAANDLTPDELESRDPAYELLITVRAEKAGPVP